ncbi:hypothetical protein [Desulfovibrio sp. SGI.169]|uniref:hypothetical protein n=1 Tax=Desulfovibrio sp. SGI.169 TaxID=3420561 RepID=UPI003CFC07F2
MSLFKKLLATLRPLYDFRALLLLFAAFLIGAVTDPAATLGLAGYLAYVIGMAGAALMLSKILMPYQRTSQHIRSALEEGNVASALVVLARVILILGLLITLMAWGK